MDSLQVCCLLLSIQIHQTASFEFDNFQVVRDMTAELAHKLNCGCIVILLPDNATQPETRFLEKLIFSIATAHNFNEHQAPKQVTACSQHQYSTVFTKSDRLEIGSCFKWLNVVMMTPSTQSLLQELSKSHLFSKAVWLIFSNGSLIESFKNVDLHFDSQVWVAKPNGVNYTISEIYRVKRGFGERVNYLGQWSEAQGLKTRNFSRQLRRQNLEGLVLRAGFTEDWTNRGRLDLNDFNLRSKESFFLYTLYYLETNLNFTTNNRLYNKDGPGIQLENGSWTGLIGMIIDDKIDIIISELDYTAKRVQVVDPLLPLITTKSQVYFQLNGYQFDWRAVFRPFHYYVWFALLSWILIGSTFLNIACRIAKKYDLETPQSVNFINGVLFTLRTLCLQGSTNTPKLWALRIAFIVSYLVATVILPSYSAALVSSLSIRTPTRPFESLSELAESNYQLIFMPHSSVAEYMTELGKQNPNFKKIINSLWLNDTKITGSLTKALEHLCTHNNVALFSTDKIDTRGLRLSNGEKMCDLANLGKSVYKIDQSFAVSKHSPYFRHMNYYLLKMVETGNIRRFKERFLPSWRNDKPEIEITLRLQNVAEIFLILILGYFLAILIFSYEIVKQRYSIN